MIPDLGIPHVAFHLPQHVDDIRGWGKRTRQKIATVQNLERAGMRYYRSCQTQSQVDTASNANAI